VRDAHIGGRGTDPTGYLEANDSRCSVCDGGSSSLRPCGTFFCPERPRAQSVLASLVAAVVEDSLAYICIARCFG
jgi:hypothetical protein